MGIYKDKKNNFSIYDAPKIGGTTIRSWVNYYKTGNLNLHHEGNGYISPTPFHYSVIKDQDYVLDFFEESLFERVVIKRDPVTRFISCYSDKVIKEGNISYFKSIDNFLDNFYDIVKSHPQKFSDNKNLGYMWYHFAPQVNQFGYNIKYYDKVFDISEIPTKVKLYLEQKWNIQLPEIHTRKNLNKINLNNEQVEKVKQIYKEDYKVGWY